MITPSPPLPLPWKAAVAGLQPPHALVGRAPHAATCSADQTCRRTSTTVRPFVLSGSCDATADLPTLIDVNPQRRSLRDAQASTPKIDDAKRCARRHGPERVYFATGHRQKT